MATTTAAPPDAPVEAPRPTPWRGALFTALMLDAVFCVGLLALIGEVIPPLIVFTIVFAGLAFATRRTSARWPAVASVVAGLLFIGGNLPFIVEDLAHPETIAAFVPIFLLTTTTVFVVIAGVLTARSAASSPTYLGIGFAIVAVFGVLMSIAMTTAVDDDTRQPGDVGVVAKDVEYPQEITVDADGFLFVENTDMFRHTFVVDDTDIHQELPGSTARRVAIDVPAGEYTFRCDVPGHERMEGVLLVE